MEAPHLSLVSLPSDILTTIFSQRIGYHYLQLVLRLVCKRFRDLFPYSKAFDMAFFAAAMGDLPTLKIFYNEGCKFSPECVYTAMRHGHKHILEYFVNYLYLRVGWLCGCIGSGLVIAETAISNNIECVLWVLKYMDESASRSIGPIPYPKRFVFKIIRLMRNTCKVSDLVSSDGSRRSDIPYGPAVIATGFASFYLREPEAALQFLEKCGPIPAPLMFGIEIPWDYPRILGIDNDRLIPEEVAYKLLKNVCCLSKRDARMLIGVSHHGVLYEKDDLVEPGPSDCGNTDLYYAIAVFMQYNVMKATGCYLKDWREWRIPQKCIVQFIFSLPSVEARENAVKYWLCEEGNTWILHAILKRAARNDHQLLDNLIKFDGYLNKVSVLRLSHLAPFVYHLGKTHNSTGWLSLSTLIGWGPPSIYMLEQALAAGIPAVSKTHDPTVSIHQTKILNNDPFLWCLLDKHFINALWFYHNNIIRTDNYEVYWKEAASCRNSSMSMILYCYTNIPYYPHIPLQKDVDLAKWPQRGPPPSRSWIPALLRLERSGRFHFLPEKV